MVPVVTPEGYTLLPWRDQFEPADQINFGTLGVGKFWIPELLKHFILEC